MRKLAVFWVLCYTFVHLKGQETVCSINSKKILHKVSDKYLSISVDPVVLLAGVNISDTTLTLIRNLSPIYLRLAGPSTHFLRYAADDSTPTSTSQGDPALLITPTAWFGVSEWLRFAEVTPIFGLDDDERVNGVWDPQRALPMLDLSDKLNISCYWQLGYDCTSRTESKYKEDLRVLKKTLDTFPNHNFAWKIVGSDISKCFSSIKEIDDIRNSLADVSSDIEAVMWERSSPTQEMLAGNNNPIFKSLRSQFSSHLKVWTSVPKTQSTITFSSVFLWVKQLDEAAKIGFDVIFRQPRLIEFTTDTPMYWLSFYQKKFMGRNVLDVKCTNDQPDALVSAHCAKNQNQFVRRGAITVLVSNNGTDNFTANVKLGLLLSEKTIEIQSYIFTAPNEDSTGVYLNGEHLHIGMLKDGNLLPKPKLRRAKLSKLISLELPPKSVGFFILSGARFPLCLSEENEEHIVLQEINQDQSFSLPKDLMTFEDRAAFTEDEVTNLEKLKRKLEEELREDGKVYKTVNRKTYEPVSQKKVKPKGEDFDSKKQSLRKYFSQSSKLKDKQEGEKHSKQFNTDSYEFDEEEEVTKPQLGIDLTKEELEIVLRKRIKAKAAARRIKFTSDEVDSLVARAVRDYKTRNKRAINRSLLEERYLLTSKLQHCNDLFTNHHINTAKHHTRDRRSLKLPKETSDQKNQSENNLSTNRRIERDINIDLLEKRTETVKHKSNRSKVKPTTENPFRNLFRKRKTTQQKETEKSVDDYFWPRSEEIFSFEAAVTPSRRKSSRKSLIVSPSHQTPKNTRKNPKPKIDDELQFLLDSEELGGIEEEMFSSHYFAPKNKNKNKEANGDWLEEFWESMRLETKKKNAARKELNFEDMFVSDEISASGEVLRRKRDLLENTKEVMKQMKEKLHNIKRHLSEDKTKFAIEKNRNRLKLLDESLLNQKKGSAQRDKMVEKLILMKKNLAKRREEIEKYLLHQLEASRSLLTETNLLEKETEEENGGREIEDEKANMIKRSIFDNNPIFESYKKLKFGTKPWDPIDYMSINTNALKTNNRILNNPHMKPLNKYYFLKHILNQYRLLPHRYRRDLYDSTDSKENEVERIPNVIYKGIEKHDADDANNNKFDATQLGEDQIENDSSKLKLTKLQNLNEQILEDNLTSSSEKLTNRISKSTSNEDLNHIQKIPKKNEKEKTFLSQVFDKLHEFLRNVGRKISSYWHDMLQSK